MTIDAWSGALYLARDFALVHGSAGITDRHAHYAHQLLLSPGAPVTVALDDETVRGPRVLVESMREHAILDAPSSLYSLYVEPTVVDTADLLMLDADTAAPTALIQSLDTLPRRKIADTRVIAALEAVDALLDSRVRAADVAARVQLSLSQLERLFTEHVGLPVRRLVRWRRLRLALALALGGSSLTQAAHDAGFADSPHFSRVMREMFGVRADRTLPGLRLQLLD